MPLPAPASAGSPLAPRIERRVGWLTVTGTAGLCFVLIAAYMALDDRNGSHERGLVAEVTQHRTPLLVELARIITTAGSGGVLVVVGLAVAGLLWWRSRQLLLPTIVLAALAGTATLVTVLKVSLARVRPFTAVGLGTPATDYSFPSGHTTNSTVVYCLSAALLGAPITVRLLRRLVTLAAAALSGVIGWSRVYLGYHWPTDVLAGWALGTALTCGALYLGSRAASAGWGPRWLGRLGHRRLGPSEVRGEAIDADDGPSPIRSVPNGRDSTSAPQ